MVKFFQVFFVVCVFCFTTSASQSCSFASHCDCSKKYQDITVVECLNVSTFPIFASHPDDVSFVIIQGNYTVVPDNAFYNLQKINYGIVLKRSELDRSAPITIKDNAFNFFHQYPISISFVSFQGMQSVPTSAFKNVTFSHIYFYDAGFLFLEANAFIGSGAYIVQMENCDLAGIDESTFIGMNIFQPAGLTLDFSNNGLEEVMNFVQTNGVTAVSLAMNNIYFVDNYAFACSPSPCNKTSSLREINLSRNPITDFGLDSFSNLPNLTSLSLQNIPFINDISAILTILKPVAATLSELDLENNAITTIPKNAFDGFSNLMFLNLHNNPVSHIDVGAFAELSAMTELVLDSFESLTSVDIEITQGMKLVNHLNLAYGGVQSLRLLDVSDVPGTLRSVDVSHNVLQTIDGTFFYWLTNCKYCTLNICYNYEIQCTPDIQWMATFVLCQPVQISATNTTCNTGELLSDYLYLTTTCTV